LLSEEIENGAGALFGKALIEIVGADAVRVAFIWSVRPGCARTIPGNLCELFASSRLSV